MSETSEIEGWGILELMGHRKLAGKLSEATIAGGAFVRIDVPGDQPTKGEDWQATQFYAPAAIYCITPCTEDLARKVAERYEPTPVSRWELPMLPEPELHATAPRFDEPEEEYDTFKDEEEEPEADAGSDGHPDAACTRAAGR